MGITEVDPLGDVTLHFLTTHSIDLCDCPASGDRLTLHAENCNMHKIYASIMDAVPMEDWPSRASLEFLNAKNSIDRYIYTCADCGAKRRVEDMVVIYEAPLGQIWGGERVNTFRNKQYNYPHNIVKVVCCTHNRSGRVGYQKVMPNGY